MHFAVHSFAHVPQPEQQHLHAQQWCMCTATASCIKHKHMQTVRRHKHAAVYSRITTPLFDMSRCTAGDADRQANGEGSSQQADGVGPSQQADRAGPSQQADGAGWEEGLMNTLAPAEVLAKAASPRYPPQQLHFLQMLAAKDPAILASFGATPQVSPHTGPHTAPPNCSPQHHHQDLVPTQNVRVLDHRFFQKSTLLLALLPTLLQSTASKTLYLQERQGARTWTVVAVTKLLDGDIWHTSCHPNTSLAVH